ncbi:MAG: sigma-70 family RNA polymerase sigma factor [Anaerolineae bacterium]|nr:sigma-70 family RNA polymerase sigma factor [Anaerolineae bacterium]
MNGHTSRAGTGERAPHKIDDEARLIERARQGDRQAVAELYRTHVDTVYRYVYTRVRDEQVAEDLTAQVFLQAIEGLPGYEVTGAPFMAWLYRIAYARVVDHYRREGRRQEVSLPEALPAETPRPEDYIEAEADWEMAIDLLAQLTDDQQDVIILRFIGEMSLAEVAKTLGKTVGAAKALQYRALATLARLLERQRADGV